MGTGKQTEVDKYLVEIDTFFAIWQTFVQYIVK